MRKALAASSLLVALPIAVLSGCSSSRGEEGAPSSNPLAGDVSPTEAQRVQAFLDGRYLASDVRHSFRSALGQDVDCIDFDAVPGVRALHAAGLPVPEAPPPPHHRAEDPPARSTPPAWVPDGTPDAQGRARACPKGTVPQARITAADVEAAGGLDAYEAPPPPLPPEAAGYAHVTAVWDNVGGINTGYDTFSIENPALGSGGHSLSQSWMFSGSKRLACNGSNAATCCNPGDPQCEQTVEVGWIKDRTAAGSTRPYIFTYATNNGYLSSGSCYNGASFPGCPTWVPGAQSPFFVGETLPASDISVAGGAQHEMTAITYNSGAGTWCIEIAVDGWYSMLGCYTGFTGLMSTTAQYFQVGGEVQSSSGFAGEEMGAPNGDVWWGFPFAAYHRNFAVYEPDTSDFSSTPSYMRNTVPGSFASNTTSPKQSGWTSYFFYGGR
ncbi:MAG TPA: neprosin family prolyl endopeptidase [Polyangiaceae bacterium]|jgi:hypothetical protein